MTCDNDYIRLDKTVVSRMTHALTSMRAGGIPKPLAVALVALSEAESAVIWALDRPIEPSSCCGQVVGIEAGQFHNAVGGHEAAIAWLNDRSYIGWNEADGTTYPKGGLGNPQTPWHAMLFYEWAVSHAYEELKATFSLGPTQLWLAQAGTVCGFPSSLVGSWSMYSTSDEAEMVKNHLLYLVPSTMFEGGCLDPAVTLPNGDRSVGIEWLRHHAGNVATATKAYDGVTNDPVLGNRKAYKTSWEEAETVAHNIDSAWQ